MGMYRNRMPDREVSAEMTKADYWHAAYLREREKSYAERREWEEKHGKPIRLSKSGVPLVKEKE